LAGCNSVWVCLKKRNIVFLNLIFLGNVCLGFFVGYVAIFLPFGRNLEYEYQLIVSLLLHVFLFSYWFFCSKFQKNICFDIDPWSSLYGWFFLSFGALIPGTVLMIVEKNPCSWHGYLFWFVMLTLPASILSWALWIVAAEVYKQSSSRWFVLRFYLFFYVPLIIYDFIKIWFFPQKRLLSFVLGYFHGPIYDRTILWHNHLLIIRLIHVVISITMILIIIHKKKRIYFISIALVFWLSGKLFLLDSPYTGHGLKLLQDQFPQKIHRKQFTLYCPAKEEFLKVCQELSEEITFHISEIVSALKLESPPYIHIFIYESMRKKKLWFGAYYTDVTDVVTPSIHISMEAWPHSTLRHELVHALTSNITWLGFHPNMALTEGLAMAIAPNFTETNYHLRSKFLLEDKKYDIDVSNLFSWKFWQYSGSRSYALAGSFLQFLIEELNLAEVKEIYRGKSIAQEHIQNWQTFLQVYPKFSHYDWYMNKTFRKPGVLRSRCPHSMVDLIKSRDDCFFKIRQPFFWETNRDYWLWRKTFSPPPNEATIHLYRQDLEKLLKKDVFPSTQEIGLFLESWPKKALKTSFQSIEDLEMALLGVDAYWLLSSDSLDIKAILQSFIKFARKKFIGYAFMRKIYVRMELLKLSSLEQRVWLEYLLGFHGIPMKKTIKIVWILKYLIMRQPEFVLERYLYKQWISDEVKDKPAYMRVAWYLAVANRGVKLKEYADARKATEKILLDVPEGGRKYVLTMERYLKFRIQREGKIKF